MKKLGEEIMTKFVGWRAKTYLIDDKKVCHKKKT